MTSNNPEQNKSECSCSKRSNGPRPYPCDACYKKFYKPEPPEPWSLEDDFWDMCSGLQMDSDQDVATLKTFIRKVAESEFERGYAKGWSDQVYTPKPKEK